MTPPYLISSVSDFNNIYSEPSAYYRQTQDIGTITTPIDVFSGNYDDGKFSITVNLSKSDNTADFGVFQTINGTSVVEIANLTLKGCISSIGGSNTINVVAIVGNGSGALKLTIDNCTNEATVKSLGGYTGGIVGQLWYSITAYSISIISNGQASQVVTLPTKTSGQTIKMLIFEDDTIKPGIVPIIAQ